MEIQACQLFTRGLRSTNTEENHFHCAIYYIVLSGLDSIKHVRAKEAVKFVLDRARIPRLYVLDVIFPPNDCCDTVILFFSNATLLNVTKKKIDTYFKNHFATSITIN